MAKKEQTRVKNALRGDEEATEVKKKPKKKAAPKKSKKSKKKIKLPSFSIGFLADPRTKTVSGLFLLLLSVYLFIAITSYFVTWFSGSADDNLSQIPFQQITLDNSLQVQNWTGRLGAVLSHLFVKQWFGVAAYLFAFNFFLIGFRWLTSVSLWSVAKSLKYSFFGLVWLSLTLGFLFSGDKISILGGIFGFELSQFLNGLIGFPGTLIVIVFAIVSFVIVTLDIKIPFFNKKEDDEEETVMSKDSTVEGLSLDELAALDGVNEEEEESPEDLAAGMELSFNDAKETETSEEEGDLTLEIDEELPEPIEESTESSEDDDFSVDVAQGDEPAPVEQEEASAEMEVEVNEGEDTSGVVHHGLDTEYDPKEDLRDFMSPDLNLLEEHGSSNQITIDKGELEENKNKIVKTLNDYGIKIDKIKATIGPTITLYEIVPAPGVRISKIRNLQDDIALSLAALGIRIIAPIPGKGTIGIEVPNKNPEIVPMKTVVASDKFQNTKFDLPCAMGKTISNDTFVFDLAKMPHLLMAGATGQGKSVGLNAIITSLLYKKHPAQLKFVMVDPKKVELSLFSKIERHYLAKLPGAAEAIITETSDVVTTLESLCVEMDIRYDLLKDAHCRNLKEYNQKFIKRKLNPQNGHRYLPYIVLIVDEFADLIMTAGKEVESPIARLAQLARAIGIHLIIATQRPSVNIITGTIKANFPARVAFRVTSKIDSRTILDAGGAEQLVGRGDMLFSTGKELIRLQCAFVDTPEVEEICNYIGNQRGYASALELPEVEKEAAETPDVDMDERDDLFEDAARIIVENQHGSTSLIQRKLKLGYNRAGRIIDQLEAAGVVGPFKGSKAREVLITDLLSLEQFLENLP